MKRIHVINLEKMGGAEKIFIEYINSAQSAGDTVFCISHQVNDEIQNQLANPKITFVNRIFSAFSLKYPAFLRKWILPLRIAAAWADVVVFWDLIPRRFWRFPRLRAVYYDHGASWRFPTSAENMSFFAQIDAAIAISNASRHIMQHRFRLNAPIEVIPGQLASAARPPYRRKTAPMRAAVTLGTASRLVSLKGIGVAIMALAELRQRGVNARLKIAGKGPNEGALRKLVESLQLGSQVEFSGFHRDLSDFYQQIDIYISMSISEAYGLSCTEALNHGVPCIYSLIDGQVEVIQHGVHGIGIVPTLTPQDYEARSGYQVEKPWLSYDPVSDTLVAPKMVDPATCADVIEAMLDSECYTRLIENIHLRNQQRPKPLPISHKINDFLYQMVKK